MSLDTSSLKFLKPDQISQDPEDLLKYGNDWLKQWKGQASVVVFPKNTKELSQIVKLAREKKIGLLASGGRTSLSGGATALEKEMVISFEKMTKILDFNPIEGTVCVQAGVITQALKDYVSSKGFHLPLSFGAEGSSQIGGNVATNLGGANVLKYGNIRRMVLGLEVVTGKGEVLNLGKGLVKNATGYNLKDLFIGSEGTLGFISKVELSLFRKPKNPQVFLMTTDKKENVLEIFKKFKKNTEPLAFEFFTDKALDYVLSHGSVSFPLEKRWPFYMLLELEEGDQDQALQIFEESQEMHQGSHFVSKLFSSQRNMGFKRKHL